MIVTITADHCKQAEGHQFNHCPLKIAFDEQYPDLAPCTVGVIYVTDYYGKDHYFRYSMWNNDIKHHLVDGLLDEVKLTVSVKVSEL